MLSSVLIIENDADARRLLMEAFAKQGGFKVSTADTLHMAQALVAAFVVNFDLLILNATLPDGDGHEFCADLRRQGLLLPIILTGGRSHEHDAVRAFDAGADDYVAASCSTAELLARVGVQFRHIRPQNEKHALMVSAWRLATELQSERETCVLH